MKGKKFLRECAAFAEQFRYMHRDLRPRFVENGKDLVLLIHGLYATAGVLRPLREHLETKLGVSTLTFSHASVVGFDEVADRIAELLPRYRGFRIHLVGHSLGGLAILEHMRRTSSEGVCSTTVLAPPLLGSPLDRLAFGRSGDDLRAESRLAELRREVLVPPHLTILAGDDFLVRGRPTTLAGENEVLPGVGHNGILFDERAKELVERHIRAAIEKSDLSAGGSVR